MRFARYTLLLLLVGCSSADEATTEVFDLRSTYWTMVCEAAVECPTPPVETLVNPHRTLEECTERPLPYFISDLNLPNTAALVEAGRLSFKPGAGEKCLADLRAAICSGAIYDLPETCRAAFEGKVPEGDPCISDLECGAGLGCKDRADGCLGTCQPHCGGSICEAGEYCLGSECLLLAAEGEICRGPSSCSGDFICSQAKCIAARSVEEGGACSDDRVCPEGSQCVDQECRPFEVVSAGESCGFGIEGAVRLCEFGTLCQNITLPDSLGTCLPPGEVGDSCQWPGQCGFGLTCSTQMAAEEGNCQKLFVAGIPCTSDHECEEGQCQQGLCVARASCNLESL